jgi:predicted small metal-binding protein
MAKVLRCDDFVPGCAAIIEGKDDKEVMQKATEHAKTMHSMTTIPPEVASKVQQAIRTKPA